jgi:hypothetical protein
LDEILLAGELQESSKKNILRCISQQDSLEDMEVSNQSSSCRCRALLVDLLPLYHLAMWSKRHFTDTPLFTFCPGRGRSHQDHVVMGFVTMPLLSLRTTFLRTPYRSRQKSYSYGFVSQLIPCQPWFGQQDMAEVKAALKDAGLL